MLSARRLVDLLVKIVYGHKFQGVYVIHRDLLYLCRDGTCELIVEILESSLLCPLSLKRVLIYVTPAGT